MRSVMQQLESLMKRATRPHKGPVPKDGRTTLTDKGGGPMLKTVPAVLLSAAGGLMILLSFPRFDQSWLAWGAAGCMMAAFRGRRFGGAFGIGMVAGFIGNMGGFYWISNLLVDFAHIPLWASWIVTCLLVAYQGIYYALAAGLSAAVTTKFPKVPWVLAFPVSYTAFEFVFPLIFPWYAANGQQPIIHVIQIADIAGAPAISFLLMTVGTAAGEVVIQVVKKRPFPILSTAVAAVLLTSTLIYGAVRIHTVDERVAAAPKFRIGMVEPDVGIWEKEAKHPDGSPMTNRERFDLRSQNLLKLQYLSRAVELEHAPDLIVWPETSYQPNRQVLVRRRNSAPGGEATGTTGAVAIPPELQAEGFIQAWPFPTDMERAFVSRSPLPAQGSFKDPLPALKADSDTPIFDRNAAIRGFSTPVIIGASSRLPDTAPGQTPVKYNTAVMLDRDGSVIGMYRKTLLLVFGEYLPFERTFPFLRKWLPEAGRWSPGDGPRVFELGQARIGISICYEDLLAPFHKKMSELDPNVIVNITNDAWFGRTREPWLHLQLAELRSVETRMFMARATNTGVSAFVDPVGRRLAHTSMDDPEYLVADVALTREDTLYMRFGDWFAWACAAFVLAMAAACVTWRRD